MGLQLAIKNNTFSRNFPYWLRFAQLIASKEQQCRQGEAVMFIYNGHRITKLQ